MGINQFEQDKTKEKGMNFKPTNISEISDFCGAVRPSFASMVSKFIKRESFNYGIDSLDSLIQHKDKPSSYIIFQEEVMKILEYAGFSRSETYTILKGIAKKNPNVISKIKDRFISGFVDKLMEENNSK